MMKYKLLKNSPFFLYLGLIYMIQKEKSLNSLIFKDFSLFFWGLFKFEFNGNAIITNKYGVDQMAGNRSFFFKFHSCPIL